jgi:hypothetical protein
MLWRRNLSFAPCRESNLDCLNKSVVLSEIVGKYAGRRTAESCVDMQWVSHRASSAEITRTSPVSQQATVFEHKLNVIFCLLTEYYYPLKCLKPFLTSCIFRHPLKRTCSRASAFRSLDSSVSIGTDYGPAG